MRERQRDYEMGDTVEYCGNGGRRIVTVTGKYEDIKDGRPGFDGILDGTDNECYWGYDADITRIVRRKS